MIYETLEQSRVIMTGQYSSEEFNMEQVDEQLVERILWLLNKVKEDKMNGSVTLRFLNGKMGKLVTVTRKEVLG